MPVFAKFAIGLIDDGLCAVLHQPVLLLLIITRRTQAGDV